jgi:seryl-tRNA synthetase
MLPIAFIRQEKARVERSLAKRQISNTQILDDIIAADDLRKSLQTNLDNCLSEANRLAKEIGGLMKQNKASEAQNCTGKIITTFFASAQLLGRDCAQWTGC